MSRIESSGPPYTGWATFAYPRKSSRDYRALLEKQLRAGANFVWGGHNNPGWVDLNKHEPALSYAVYEEALDPGAPRHEEAKGMLDAQVRFLEVCRDLGMPIVFPIGYQIQMGRWWEIRHPEHLRRDRHGKVLDWGGVSASIYSPRYQEDISRYYRWVAETLIEPFKDIVLMVNLADEPFGGDYSSHAEAEFRKRHGFGFDDVGEYPENQRLLGEFQSDVIVDYARWSADAWHQVCPEIPSTMSFCGFHGREENFMPTVVNLFRKTPPYFEITFDLYPRDGPFDHPITVPDIQSLWFFLTQLGCLSRRYRKPLWLWPTGNSWGTGQESRDPGQVSDAVANMVYGVDRMAASGGIVKGLAIWNFNCNNQGLFDDPHPTAYDPEVMFQRLSEGFRAVAPVMRQTLQPQPPGGNRLGVYAPPEPGFLRVGRSRALVARLGQPETRPYDFSALEILFQQAEPFDVYESLDSIPDDCSVLVVLPECLEELPEKTREALRSWLTGGRTLLIRPRMADLFRIQYKGAPFEKYTVEGGVLLIADTDRALRLEHRAIYEPLWREILPSLALAPVFHYRVPWREFWYNLTGGRARIDIDLAEGQQARIHGLDCSTNGSKQGPDRVDLELPHHAFATVEKI